MKFENYETVQKLITIKNKLEQAIADTDTWLAKEQNERPDIGGVGENFSKGYNCNLSKFNDGSGSSINLYGCYVAKEMLEATRLVLVSKLALCKTELEGLGVEL